jgi:dTDP-4-dehydrorhamnose 3,5-epimerase
MDFIATDIEGLFTIKCKKLVDERGIFTRTFCKNEFKQIGFEKEFVQFNQSFNRFKGTIRGLHFQNAPYTETKLIRCVAGSVFDVAVDLRKSSPTFLKYFGTILSAENMDGILIPNGFAHGFQTLEDNTSLIYHHTEYYQPNAEAGIRFDDPAIGVLWKLPATNISPKDRSYNLLNQNFEAIIL